VRSGEVCFAQTVRIPEFKTIALRLSAIFRGLRGNICFQGFLDRTGRATVFEINARFGGGYPICDQAGGTYAKWIVQDVIGVKPDYNDAWQEGLRMLRYDAAVFVPLQ
jgi:carbamoyl-phosphate synthase large subunit